MEHKTLGFGPIWPENLDNIRMRSIFAWYLRKIDQIFPLIQTENNSDLTGQAIKWKRSKFSSFTTTTIKNSYLYSILIIVYYYLQYYYFEFHHAVAFRLHDYIRFSTVLYCNESAESPTGRVLLDQWSSHKSSHSKVESSHFGFWSSRVKSVASLESSHWFKSSRVN
jgi:hypothetical protein